MLLWVVGVGTHGRFLGQQAQLRYRLSASGSQRLALTSHHRQKLLYLGAAFALVALVAIQLARDDFDPAAETAPEEGGLLHHPRRPNPSGIITFALLLITGLLHWLAQP